MRLGLLLLLFISLPAQAISPWMRSGGEWYYRGGISWSSGDQFWNENSNLVDDSCRSSSTRMSHTVEHGYNYYYTLVGSIQMANKNCGADHNSGIGDLRVGVRGRLNPFRSDRTWEVTAIIPTGYSRSDSLRLGHGRFGLEAGIAGLFRGSERTPASLWSQSANISVRHWFGPQADQILGTVKTRRQYEQGRLSFSLRGVFSFRNEKPEQVTLLKQTQASDYDEVAANISWSARLDDEWRYNARVGHTLWGRNTGHDLTIGLSIGRSWDP